MRLSYLLVAALLMGGIVTHAQFVEPSFGDTSNAEAKAKFKEALPLIGKDPSASLVLLEQAIELDPNYGDAHRRYTLQAYTIALRDQARGDELKQNLKSKYEAWTKKYADKAAVLWGRGTVGIFLMETDAGDWFRKAIEVDPKFKPSYASLAAWSPYEGHPERSRELLKKAVDLDPNDATVVLSYVATFQSGDLAAYRQQVDEMAKKFPSNNLAVYALINLYSTVPTVEERRQVLERIQRDFASQQNPLPTTHVPMRFLFDMIAEQDAAKALDFAREREKLAPAFRQWGMVVKYQEELVQALGLINGKKFDEAAAALEKLVPPWSVSAVPLFLARAEAAAGADNVQKAYDSLLRVEARMPIPKIRAALNAYGAKLGKNAAKVKDDLWELRDGRTEEMKPFELRDYATGKNVKLEDYRGRIVLVNFWSPNCTACRTEFPYLAELAQKYKAKGLTILGINTRPDEEKLVFPYMKPYEFTLLHAPSRDWVRLNYDVNTTPMNYLLDPDGRVVHRVLVPSRLSMDQAAAQIDSLYERYGAK